MTGQSDLQLQNGSRVAVMGGGPAGALFSYFLLKAAARADLRIQVDIYEPKNFAIPGPAGCNMCAGIVSESLVQMLAVEGLYLPASVVQRGIDSYVMHTNAGKVRFETPQLEMRIATVFRGVGPLGTKDSEWSSFDGYLLEKATQEGASWIHRRIEVIERLDDGRLQVRGRGGPTEMYDFLAVACGVNTSALRLFQTPHSEFRSPQMMQTFVREYYLGKEQVERYLGSHTIHFFLLNIAGLDFAAFVPKGNYATMCLLGKDLDEGKREAFLSAPEVRDCMPPGWQASEFACHCAPRINVSGAIHPFADRMVFLGDSGVSRLYKDGIGAAYRAAKIAASTAVFHGISEADWRRYYWPSCRKMKYDNLTGKVIFAGAGLFKPSRLASRALLRMVVSEMPKPIAQRKMSTILWNMFTGSAPYLEIFLSIFHPAFWSRFIWHLCSSLVVRSPRPPAA